MTTTYSGNRVTFDFEGDFQSSYAAEKWLKDRGFSYGPSQAMAPTAIWFGDCSISKWRNLSAQDKREMHAVMLNQRNGPVNIDLMPGASDEAIAAFMGGRL